VRDLGKRPGLLRLRVLGLALIANAALIVGVAGGSGLSSAQDGAIPAGFDLFETDPEQTVFRFQGPTSIPADFFDQGSKQFQGNVPFGGVPIDSFRSSGTGNADTIVERKSAATLPQDGSPSAPIPIELVQLSLASMAPLEVQVGQQTQLWEAHAVASPARPSTGQMSIARGGPNGGRFESSLTVYPKFTFRRLSDGVTRELDIGALPDNQRPEITIELRDGTWRAGGCTAPALAIRNLNGSFCAGQAPDDRLVLQKHQAPRLEHAVLPVQPKLEHFNCYALTVLKVGKNPAVKLTDQFGDRNGKVTRRDPKRDALCNPVQKSGEPLVNKRDHLRCYRLNAPVEPKTTQVWLRNQFHLFRAEVNLTSPPRLCLPTAKAVNPKQPPTKPRFRTEHFLCYPLKPIETPGIKPFEGGDPKLKDQFLTHAPTVKNPNALCTPVAKNGRALNNSVEHLVCYPYKKRGKTVTVNVRNQFGLEKLRTAFAHTLCVPTTKDLN
jgi:hypothetical protein